MNKTAETEKKQKNTASPEPIELPLEDIWRGLLKYWWLCLLLMLLGAGLMFYRSYIHFVPVYQCSATFTVQTQQVGSTGITSYAFTYNRATALQLANTFESIMQSNILQDVIKNDLEMAYMPASLSASSVSGTNMFTITAKGNDAQLTYDTLLSAIRNYPSVAEYVIGNTQMNMLSEPILPTEPTNRLAYRQQVLLGAVGGLALGICWILLYAFSRNTVRARTDIRQKLNQNCLGTLPRITFKKHNQEINRSVLLTNPLLSDGYAESCRAIRNTLTHKSGEETEHKVIMVTSTAPGEGKTTTAINLAISISRLHQRVLLVDADLRNPGVNDAVGLPPAKFKDNQAYIFTSLPDTAVTLMNFNTENYKLWQLARVSYLTELFNSLRSRYDYIIVDTSPSGLTADPAIIAQAVDAAVFVIRHDTVRISRIAACLSSQLQDKVTILGCILNGFHEGPAGYSRYANGYNYSYNNNYSYGYGSESRETPLRRFFRKNGDSSGSDSEKP